MPGNRFVFDTHSLIWSLCAPKRLGRKARMAMKQVEEGLSQAWIPAAVAFEVSMLRELGRINIGLPELQEAVQDTSSIQFLSLDWQQVDTFSSLAQIRDPFDRMIVSAARTQRAKLITKDENIQDTGLVQTVWG